MFTLILLYFVPPNQIAKKKPKIPIQVESMLKSNFKFDQLIERNVSQITATARALSCAALTGQVNYAWAWFREPRV